MEANDGFASTAATAATAGLAVAGAETSAEDEAEPLGAEDAAAAEAVGEGFPQTVFVPFLESAAAPRDGKPPS